ncbi:MarR family winged helix-turn-helix transcriptional regulator [Myceligenerans salitolerans]|uniref:Winged helix-turn-helix transcriptional regulator n=1 Tax=Myceligenerans salitolerans TaxID=1230528 RepID=A0ABS3IF26_9MICO|nr:MarR family winged helix-turn-helix transcriptional regulator [Myceligenerans salitolerans]MBO0611068.1 winged helix-turn-helix transcriptional regulator [Myceligenerans salitolerans]
MDPQVTLGERERRTWAAFVTMRRDLEGALARDLARDGLSVSDFEVLARLDQAPGGEMRARDLAAAIGWDKARLSKHVTRMVARGLVERREAAEDGRGQVVVLTTGARQVTAAAVPNHVAAVRRHFFDLIEPDELDVLDRVLTRINARAVEG